MNGRADADIALASLVGGSNALGFRLLSLQMEEDVGQTIFLSSFSVLVALAMAYNGAEGRTKAAMSNVLGAQDLSLTEVNEACTALLSMGDRLNRDAQLAFANAIWLAHGISPDTDFVDRVKSAYRSGITSVDFDDPATADMINDWVAGKTNERIDQLVTPKQIARAVMVLTNAVAFKGVWSSQFEEEKTAERPFMLLEGVSRLHPMMSQKGQFDYFETKSFQSLHLPYGTGRVCMTILLPRADSSIQQIGSSITADGWKAWMGQYTRREGRITLPRFKLEYEADLLPSLKLMGGDAFASTDFLKMGAGPLFISNVLHKTCVEVDEEGTEAAAATAVMMVRSVSLPFQMVVDRPFLCAIQDRETGLILFLGCVLDPSRS